ncbi:MAG TPA: DUF438 domain-containing protein [Myxococcales bacterium]|nr:DUF438 domain-containing protein [Myxococcales bacterium]
MKTLNENTKIHDLLETHPFLLDYLVGYAPEFSKLKSPAVRATLGRIATVAMAAKLAGKEPKALLEDLASEIERQTGERPVIGEPAPATPEEAQARREALKSIVRGLHEGEDLADLKERFDLLLRDVGATEIGRMENELITLDGVPAEEVRRLCTLHVEVFKPTLAGQGTPETEPGHPVHTFMLETRALERASRALEAEIAALGAPPQPERFEARRAAITGLLEQLSSVERHYVRKENLLFPLLEKAGVSGPPQVMWAVHDALRALLKAARAAAEAGAPAALAKSASEATTELVDIVFKEEAILFPMCLDLFTDTDWAEVREAEAEIGYTLAKPGTGWRPREEAEQPAQRGLARLALDTGLLSLEQVNLVLSHLPVEISFVDENDEVRYYSGGETRIFPRSPQVIGRKVQNCHPPKSQHIVQRILEELRQGTRDSAEFWINMRGRMLLIRYFAVRDAKKTYRGTLEVTQDVTHIRELEGERRLLDWS